MVMRTIDKIFNEIPTFEEILKMSEKVSYDELPEEQKKIIDNLIDIIQKRVIIQIRTENEDIKNIFRLLAFYKSLMDDNNLYNMRSTLFGILVSNLCPELRVLVEALEKDGIFTYKCFRINIGLIFSKLLRGDPTIVDPILRYLRTEVRDDDIKRASNLYKKLIKGKFSGILFPSSDLLYKFRFLFLIREIAEAILAKNYNKLKKSIRKFYNFVGEKYFGIHALRLHLHRNMKGEFYERFRFKKKYFDIKAFPRNYRERDEIVRKYCDKVDISLLDKIENDDLLVLGEYILVGVPNRKIWNYEKKKLEEILNSRQED